MKLNYLFVPITITAWVILGLTTPNGPTSPFAAAAFVLGGLITTILTLAVLSPIGQMTIKEAKQDYQEYTHNEP